MRMLVTQKLILLSTLCLLGGGRLASAQQADFTARSKALELGKTPQLSPAYAKGVSGHFASLQAAGGDSTSMIMIIGGGCNFPDKPVAEGGEKRYYDEVYISTPFNKDTAPQWRLAGRLSVPLAYAQVQTHPDGSMTIYGGETAKGDTKLIHHISADGSVRLETRTQLKYGHSGGVLLGKHIYGGHISMGFPWGSGRTAVSYDLNTGKTIASFTERAPLKLIGGEWTIEGERLAWLIGSIEGFDSDKPVERGAFLYTEEIDKRGKRTWERRPLPRHPLGTNFGGGASVALDDKTYLLVGGVNDEVFTEALQRAQRLRLLGRSKGTALYDSLQRASEQYLLEDTSYFRFNPSATLWTAESLKADNPYKWRPWAVHPTLARADAVYLLWGNSLIVVGGELMPGIRSSSISQVFPLAHSDQD